MADYGVPPNPPYVFYIFLNEGNTMNDIKLQSSITDLNDAERQPCEIWTRVMGYHRPVSSFNIGKQGEFHERTYFREAAVKAA